MAGNQKAAKRWRIVRGVTMAVIIIFGLVILTMALAFWMDPAEYPEKVYGLSRFEAFGMAAAFVSLVGSPLLLTDIVLLIISCVKGKK